MYLNGQITYEELFPAAEAAFNYDSLLEKFGMYRHKTGMTIYAYMRIIKEYTGNIGVTWIQSGHVYIFVKKDIKPEILEYVYKTTDGPDIVKVQGKTKLKSEGKSIKLVPISQVKNLQDLYVAPPKDKKTEKKPAANQIIEKADKDAEKNKKEKQEQVIKQPDPVDVPKVIKPLKIIPDPKDEHIEALKTQAEVLKHKLEVAQLQYKLDVTKLKDELSDAKVFKESLESRVKELEKSIAPPVVVVQNPIVPAQVPNQVQNDNIPDNESTTSENRKMTNYPPIRTDKPINLDAYGTVFDLTTHPRYTYNPNYKGSKYYNPNSNLKYVSTVAIKKKSSTELGTITNIMRRLGVKTPPEHLYDISADDHGLMRYISNYFRYSSFLLSKENVAEIASKYKDIGKMSMNKNVIVATRYNLHSYDSVYSMNGLEGLYESYNTTNCNYLVVKNFTAQGEVFNYKQVPPGFDIIMHDMFYYADDDMLRELTNYLKNNMDNVAYISYLSIPYREAGAKIELFYDRTMRPEYTINYIGGNMVKCVSKGGMETAYEHPTDILEKYGTSPVIETYIGEKLVFELVRSLPLGEVTYVQYRVKFSTTAIPSPIKDVVALYNERMERRIDEIVSKWPVTFFHNTNDLEKTVEKIITTDLKTSSDVHNELLPYQDSDLQVVLRQKICEAGIKAMLRDNINVCARKTIPNDEEARNEIHVINSYNVIPKIGIKKTTLAIATLAASAMTLAYKFAKRKLSQSKFKNLFLLTSFVGVYYVSTNTYRKISNDQQAQYLNWKGMAGRSKEERNRLAVATSIAETFIPEGKLIKEIKLANEIANFDIRPIIQQDQMLNILTCASAYVLYESIRLGSRKKSQKQKTVIVNKARCKTCTAITVIIVATGACIVTYFVTKNWERITENHTYYKEKIMYAVSIVVNVGNMIKDEAKKYFAVAKNYHQESRVIVQEAINNNLVKIGNVMKKFGSLTDGGYPTLMSTYIVLPSMIFTVLVFKTLGGKITTIHVAKEKIEALEWPVKCINIRSLELLDEKGQLSKPIDFINSTCTCKTKKWKSVGPQFTTLENDPVIGYTYENCRINNVMALMRMVTKRSPDPKILQDFSAFMSDIVLPTLKIRLDALGDNDVRLPPFNDYLKDIEPGKRQAYADGFDSYDKIDPHYDYSYSAFCKTGEVNYTTHDAYHNNQLTSRPRLIFNPCDRLKSCSYLCRTFMKISKMICPWYIHGMNTENLEDRLDQILPKDFVVSFDCDGSSHDANQHYTNIELVDHQINALIFDRMTRTDQPIAYEKFKKMFNDANNLESSAKLFVGSLQGRRCVMGVIKMKGGVQSGQPFFTSHGNTWRVICYLLYVLYKAGVHPKHLFSPNRMFGLAVSGDDVAGTLHKFLVKNFEESFWNVYSKEEKPTYGLGQGCKKLTLNKDKVIHFLSKTGIPLKTGWYLQRELSKALFGANATDTTMGLECVDDVYKYIFDATTIALGSWCRSVPILRKILEWRANYFESHSIKKLEDRKTKIDYYKYYSNTRSHTKHNDLDILLANYHILEKDYGLDAHKVDLIEEAITTSLIANDNMHAKIVMPYIYEILGIAQPPLSTTIEEGEQSVLIMENTRDKLEYVSIMLNHIGLGFTNHDDNLWELKYFDQLDDIKKKIDRAQKWGLDYIINNAYHTKNNNFESIPVISSKEKTVIYPVTIPNKTYDILNDVLLKHNRLNQKVISKQILENIKYKKLSQTEFQLYTDTLNRLIETVKKSRDVTVFMLNIRGSQREEFLKNLPGNKDYEILTYVSNISKVPRRIKNKFMEPLELYEACGKFKNKITINYISIDKDGKIKNNSKLH